MTTVHGEIQIRALDAAKTRNILLAEFHTRDCGSATDKEQKPFLPLKPVWVKPDSYIGLYYKGEAGAETIRNPPDSVVMLDCTYRRVTDKKEFGMTLILPNFTYGRDLGTTDVVTPKTGEWGELGLYKVPAGIEVALGRRGDGYAYVLLTVA